MIISLHRCMHVCSSWREGITKNIWKNTTKRNFIRSRIERAISPERFPSNEEICVAKWLTGKRIIKKSSFHQAIENIRARIRDEPKGRITEEYPGLEFVTCAAALAHHRLLGPVKFIRLGDVDLSTG